MRGSEERERRRRPHVIHNEVRRMKVSRTWFVAATIVTLVLSACTAGDGGDASSGEYERAGSRPAPAAVGAAGPVRRLLRRPGARLLRGGGPDRRAPRRRTRRHSAAGRIGAGWSRVHDQLGAEGAPGARGGIRPRQHRADLPGSGDPVGRVGRLRHHVARGLRGQEGRRLGLRQRARGRGLRPLRRVWSPITDFETSSSRST